MSCTLTRAARRSRCAAAFVATTALLGACPAPPEPPSPNPPPPATGLSLGPPQALLHVTVPAGGDTLVLDDGALAGLSIEIPADAWSDEVTLDVRVQEIVAHPFGENVNPLTPLIEVETDGGLADAPVLVTLPIDLPPGHFAMAFFVDDDAETLEGMPLLGLSDAEVLTATRHFSKFLVSSVAEENLLASVDTGFDQGDDNWQFRNFGSWLSPGGYCAGQSLSMIWYYLERNQKPPGEHELFGLWDNEGDVDFPTLDFDFDDARGIRLASVLQANVNWHSWDRISELLLQRGSPPPHITLNAFAYAMLVTGEPQYVALRAPAGGHAVVAYRKEHVDVNESVEVRAAPTPTWTCAMAHYDADDGCDCGCGVVDPDCSAAEVEACDTCTRPGSCSEVVQTLDGDSDCPGSVNALYNALCGGMPQPTQQTTTVYGPAVLAISDPNFPAADEKRAIVYDINTAAWLPYAGGRNVHDTRTTFTEFLYQGWSALIDLPRLEREYARLEADTVGDGAFPDYGLVWQEVHDGGDGSLPATVTTADRDLRILTLTDLTAAHPVDMRVTVFGDDLFPTGTREAADAVRVHLADEYTRLGALVEGFKPASGSATAGRYEYVDFHWFTVQYTPPLPGAPTLLDQFDLPSEPRDVALRGEYLFIADIDPGLRVAVQPGASPTLHAVPDLYGHGTGRSVTPSLDGNYAWLTVGSFQIVDVRDPAAMATLGGHGFGADLKDHAVLDDEIAFVVGSYTYQDRSILGAVDLKDPEDAFKGRGLGAIEIDDSLRSVALTDDGNYAITAGEYGEVYVVDVHDPSAPFLAATVSDNGSGWGIVRVVGDRAYVAGPGLRVFDISDPLSPTRLNPYSENDSSPRDLWVAGDQVYLVGPRLSGGGYFAVLDNTDYTREAEWLHVLPLPGATASTLWVEGERAYVGETVSGSPLTGRVSIIDVDG